MGAHDHEGVDKDGFIVAGADVELIPEAYQPALESVVSTLVAAVNGLISVYLYGSVATGEACPPQSGHRRARRHLRQWVERSS